MSKDVRPGLARLMADDARIRHSGVVSGIVFEPVSSGSISLDGVTFTEKGLNLSDDTTYDEWVEVGMKLARANDKVRWLVGDWIKFGERHYGEMYSQALELTGLEYGTLRNRVYVAERFELSRRRDKLSFSHHSAVASLPAESADKLLDIAEENGLSTRELRQAAAKVREAIKHPALVLARAELACQCHCHADVCAECGKPVGPL